MWHEMQRIAATPYLLNKLGLLYSYANYAGYMRVEKPAPHGIANRVCKHVKPEVILYHDRILVRGQRRGRDQACN